MRRRLGPVPPEIVLGRKFIDVAKSRPKRSYFGEPFFGTARVRESGPDPINPVHEIRTSRSHWTDASGRIISLIKSQNSGDPALGHSFKHH